MEVLAAQGPAANAVNPVTVNCEGHDTTSNLVSGPAIGLVNLGNTCFFNAAVQLLLACPQLNEVAFPNWGQAGIPCSLPHGNGRATHLHAAPAVLGRGPLGFALQQAFVNVNGWYSRVAPVPSHPATHPYPHHHTLGPGKSAYNPHALLAAVCRVAPQFKGRQQHDSHELMRLLLDGLQEEEKRAAGMIRRRPSKDLGRESPPPLSSPSGTSTCTSMPASHSSTTSHSTSTPAAVPSTSTKCSASITPVAAEEDEEPSVLRRLFGGELLSCIRCSTCGHIGCSRESFYDLSLQIPEDLSSMVSRNMKAQTATASEAGSKANQDEGKSKAYKKLSKRQVREMEKKMKKASEAKKVAADEDKAGTKGQAKVKDGVKVKYGKLKGHQRQVEEEEEGELDSEQEAAEEAKIEEAVPSKDQQQSGEQRKGAKRREEMGDMGTAAANGTRFKESAAVAVESGKKLSRKQQHKRNQEVRKSQIAASRQAKKSERRAQVEGADLSEEVVKEEHEQQEKEEEETECNSTTEDLGDSNRKAVYGGATAAHAQDCGGRADVLDTTVTAAAVSIASQSPVYTTTVARAETHITGERPAVGAETTCSQIHSADFAHSPKFATYVNPIELVDSAEGRQAPPPPACGKCRETIDVSSGQMSPSSSVAQRQSKEIPLRTLWKPTSSCPDGQQQVQELMHEQGKAKENETGGLPEQAPPPSPPAILDVGACLAAFFAAESVSWRCQCQRVDVGDAVTDSLLATPVTPSLRKQVSWSPGAPEVFLVPGSAEQRGTNLQEAMRGNAPFFRPAKAQGAPFIIQAQLDPFETETMFVQLLPLSGSTRAATLLAAAATRTPPPASSSSSTATSGSSPIPTTPMSPILSTILSGSPRSNSGGGGGSPRVGGVLPRQDSGGGTILDPGPFSDRGLSLARLDVGLAWRCDSPRDQCRRVQAAAQLVMDCVADLMTGPGGLQHLLNTLEGGIELQEAPDTHKQAASSRARRSNSSGGSSDGGKVRFLLRGRYRQAAVGTVAPTTTITTIAATAGGERERTGRSGSARFGNGGGGAGEEEEERGIRHSLSSSVDTPLAVSAAVSVPSMTAVTAAAGGAAVAAAARRHRVGNGERVWEYPSALRCPLDHPAFAHIARMRSMPEALSLSSVSSSSSSSSSSPEMSQSGSDSEASGEAKPAAAFQRQSPLPPPPPVLALQDWKAPASLAVAEVATVGDALTEVTATTIAAEEEEEKEEGGGGDALSRPLAHHIPTCATGAVSVQAGGETGRDADLEPGGGGDESVASAKAQATALQHMHGVNLDPSLLHHHHHHHHHHNIDHHHHHRHQHTLNGSSASDPIAGEAVGEAAVEATAGKTGGGRGGREGHAVTICMDGDTLFEMDDVTSPSSSSSPVMSSSFGFVRHQQGSPLMPCCKSSVVAPSAAILSLLSPPPLDCSPLRTHELTSPIRTTRVPATGSGGSAHCATGAAVDAHLTKATTEMTPAVPATAVPRLTAAITDITAVGTGTGTGNSCESCESEDAGTAQLRRISGNLGGLQLVANPPHRRAEGTSPNSAQEFKSVPGFKLGSKPVLDHNVIRGSIELPKADGTESTGTISQGAADLSTSGQGAVCSASSPQPIAVPSSSSSSFGPSSPFHAPPPMFTHMHARQTSPPACATPTAAAPTAGSGSDHGRPRRCSGGGLRRSSGGGGGGGGGGSFPLSASKQYYLRQAPEVLLLHLKRFSLSPRGCLTKINKHVSFGTTLDLGQFVRVGAAAAAVTSAVSPERVPRPTPMVPGPSPAHETITEASSPTADTAAAVTAWPVPRGCSAVEISDVTRAAATAVLQIAGAAAGKAIDGGGDEAGAASAEADTASSFYCSARSQDGTNVVQQSDECVQRLDEHQPQPPRQTCQLSQPTPQPSNPAPPHQPLHQLTLAEAEAAEQLQQTFSAAPELQQQQQDCLYDLLGVVEHSGEMRFGHYVAYVKRCSSSAAAGGGSGGGGGRSAPQWYQVSDTAVRLVEEAKVLQAQAYILLYARRREEKQKDQQYLQR